MEAERPLRVAIVAPPYYPLPPRSYGGIERVCSTLADELVRRGHDVTLLGAGTSSTKAHFVATFPEPQPEGTSDETAVELVHAARASAALAEVEPDLTHDHTRGGLLAACARQTPTLATVHAPLAGPESLYELYDAIGDRVPLVALSESQRRAAPTLPWLGVVPNGVDPGDYPFRERKEDFVLYLGRMSRHKGVHLAIRAALEAGRRLVLAGTWTIASEREYLEDEVLPTAGAEVEWVGAVEGAERTSLLSRASCLLFPASWEEPFGLVMLEAMACGTPVVALRAGAVPEVVADGRTGRVCDRPEQLAGALADVARIDPADCRAHVAERFTVGRMAAGYERVYRALLDRRRRAA